MILKLPNDDPERELEFELDYLLSLTTAERFEMMDRSRREVLRTLIEHGHIKPCEIIKRPLK
jgi:hypothetical protein